ncbi:MAG: hypothetical protein MR883_07760 [Clostridiales bacterium]|nr:hypothetical protein [Clostridiales bacterium]
MPVLRQHHARDFTTIPNALLQDQRLSCRDRGLLVWMLSKPPDWEFSKLSIVDELKLDGESSIKSGIKNLKATGYLEIRQERIKGKVSRSVWTVSDTPQGCFNPTALPQGRFPPMENSPYTKERINKRKKAAPAFEGGTQLPDGIFFDSESGEFRRKGNA